MNVLFAFGFALIVLLAGAILHEKDMARNCARDGNAHAWLHDIKCEVIDHD